MNLFVTRNSFPQSLPGDLGPLVELRTTDPELQLIVPAMHFAEHAHMNKLFGLHDVAGIEQVVLVLSLCPVTQGRGGQLSLAVGIPSVGRA
jgi:hypothetical protein